MATTFEPTLSPHIGARPGTTPRSGATVTRPATPAWRLADPYPLRRGTRRAFRSIVRVVCPLEAGIGGDDIVDRVERQVRCLLQYLNPWLARGFWLLALLLDVAPLWRLRGIRRLHTLERDQAADALAGIMHSRSAMVRNAFFPLRAAILSAYYDQPEVQAAIGFAPEPWLKSRVQLRERILLGEPVSQDDMIPGGPPVDVEVTR